MRPRAQRHDALSTGEIVDRLHDLPEAVDRSDVGFFFIEGGCLAMAVAIRDAVRAVDGRPRIVANDGHAWVEVGDVQIDAEGVWSKAHMKGGRSVRSVPALARAWGIDGSFPSDLEVARGVVDSALSAPRLASRNGRTTASRR